MATKKEKGSELESSIETTKRDAALSVRAPNMATMEICIIGESPFVQNKFSEKAKQQIMATQAAGSTAGSKKTRKPKDFDQVCQDATHFSRQGWIGMAAPAFRKAMISACRTVGFKMTLAKLAVFVKPDGYDRDDGMPLVRIYGKWRRHDMAARNDNGSVDIRSRPMWENWAAKVTVRFDADIFTQTDIANLMVRVGMQVGVGEGRHDSKDSAGVGWGEFRLGTPEEFSEFLAAEEKAA